MNYASMCTRIVFIVLTCILLTFMQTLHFSIFLREFILIECYTNVFCFNFFFTPVLFVFKFVLSPSNPLLRMKRGPTIKLSQSSSNMHFD